MPKSPFTAEELPPIEEFQRAFLLDEETGKIYWREPPPQIQYLKGKEAGTFHKHSGYRWIIFRGYRLLAHRVVFMLKHGRWPNPDKVIDHWNRDRGDNRPSNLREVDHATNLRNTEAVETGKNNKHGLAGVKQNTRQGQTRYFSEIVVDGKRIYLGTFDTKEEAHAAHVEAKCKYHGYLPDVWEE